MLKRALPIALCLMLPLCAQAQSSLGIQSFSGELSYGTTDRGQTIASADAQIGVNITEVHGLQLDIGLADTGTIVAGTLGAHLYMQPVASQKYGLFASLTDADEFSVQYVNAGIEGRIAVSPATTVEARFGIGGTTGMGGTATDQWDYVFAGAGVLHNLTDTMTLTARVDIAEFDEGPFSAIGLDSQLRLSHSPRGSNFELWGELRNASLYGQNAAPAITSVGLGVTLNLGNAGESLIDRPFQNADPLDQLISRGIVRLY
ncbi:hypothetical protein L0664_05955 [Octadecabacter sp. G9-8]|uniref:Porin domain-containing protein n=1 Tax=Octadecabacter dasysiphoniae TaxID=2909341 RepID=A0ABS9CX37_9RHOB|nr:hypothetical protein [Octadecabacter dasysiphoniae]MCF2870603.1 hypothetical protein [Octadecabacter dasysiphoniae]